MNLKITHIADTHLKETEVGRLIDSLADFSTAVHLMGDSDCVLHCGDFFDNKKPSPGVINWLKNFVLTEKFLSNKNFVCITGNHDKTAPHWLTASTSIGILEAGRIEEVYKDVSHKPLRILSAGDLDLESLKDLLKKYAKDPIAEQPDVIMWHGAFAPLMQKQGVFCSGKEADSSLIELFPERTSFFALGDIHITHYEFFKNAKGDKVLTGYPGSTTLTNGAHAPDKYIVNLTYELPDEKSSAWPKLVPFTKTKKTTADSFIRKILIPNTRQVKILYVDSQKDLEDAIADIEALDKETKYLVRCFLRKRIEGANAKLKLAVKSPLHEVDTKSAYRVLDVDYVTDLNELALNQNTANEFRPPNIADVLERCLPENATEAFRHLANEIFRQDSDVGATLKAYRAELSTAGK